MDATVRRVELPHEDAPGGHVNAYCLGTDNALLVDPGVRTDGLDTLLADRAVAGVALTHHHDDHAGALAHAARETDATVWARYGRAAAFERATGVTPDRTFREGTVIETGAGPVEVVETPGHAPEHVAFAVDGPEGRTLVSGDLAFAAGSVAVCAPEGDMRAYLSSLRRVGARRPARLLPGHGPAVEDPRATVERLVAHRHDREQAVLEAVAGGAARVETITDRAYVGEDIAAVRALAEGSVRAHLEKLAAERRLGWDGERVRPR